MERAPMDRANHMIGKYLIAAGLLFAARISGLAQTWTAANAPSLDWVSPVYSTNGDRVFAVARLYGIYTSTNSGLDWSRTSAPQTNWTSVACSADGSLVVATVSKNQESFPGNNVPGPLYISRDSGATWNMANVPLANWSSVACSFDGKILLAASGDGFVEGPLYVSTDSGVTWNPAPLTTFRWDAVAMSGDGQLMYAKMDFGSTYVSTNQGVTWNLGAAPSTLFGLSAASADGLHQVAFQVSGSLRTSDDGGTNWTTVPGSGGVWQTVAASPNGAWRIAMEGFGRTWISYVPESAPWFVSQPIASTNVDEAKAVKFKAAALGSAPIVFQWQLNGTNLSDDARITGSATSELTISNLQVSDSGTYTLIATNGLGMTNCESLLTVVPDLERPSLTITSPRAREKVAAAGFQVLGTVSDNSQVAGVWFQLDSGPWTPAGTSDGWRTWYASFNPTNGANTISAFALDQVGNASLTNSVSFFAIHQSPMFVRINGQGRVTPNYDSKMLTVGSRYKIAAHPAHGYIFAGWSGNLEALTPTLPFIMQEDLSVEADFVPNPFPAVRGKYSGISETNSPIPGPRMLKVQVSANGAFAAVLDNYHFSGKFSADGMASHSFSPKGIPPLLIQLQVDLIGGNTVTGTVTEGGVPSSTIVANKISGH
jgi:Immunoglobulin I-set domain/Divergent InlB B-repeat domain/Bacterial Ig domain